MKRWAPLAGSDFEEAPDGTMVDYDDVAPLVERIKELETQREREDFVRVDKRWFDKLVAAERDNASFAAKAYDAGRALQLAQARITDLEDYIKTADTVARVRTDELEQRNRELAADLKILNRSAHPLTVTVHDDGMVIIDDAVLAADKPSV
jgi:hypothetical protein